MLNASVRGRDAEKVAKEEKRNQGLPNVSELDRLTDGDSRSLKVVERKQGSSCSKAPPSTVL